ncbi:D-aminoacyl-tRNA deacylase [Deinococcus sp. KNUC1210]|uniref:D-aminoacyl-tRNA deacylase n=1 Tax=Deinococcus sp. KNUC1210 TaxID=2917691 RepID=UPI001EEFA62B|nr:D-aminoacyl-tRNA deacylase [Deinococcus sp. KNUC1210]ULH16427.1 D-aminoacyl-tRNA deacylase [Deinococcus sp. KNUC1210]
MKAVVQRVSRADCVVEGRVTGQIGVGLAVLLGVAPADTAQTAQLMASKLVKLRIFSDAAGKMNRALLDLRASGEGGAVLSISQFTLFADTRRGNRPGFSAAAGPEQGRALYAAFNEALRGLGVPVEEGIFGADMQVTLTNDGPVTLVLDSLEWS